MRAQRYLSRYGICYLSLSRYQLPITIKESVTNQGISYLSRYLLGPASQSGLSRPPPGRPTEDLSARCLAYNTQRNMVSFSLKCSGNKQRISIATQEADSGKFFMDADQNFQSGGFGSFNVSNKKTIIFFIIFVKNQVTIFHYTSLNKKLTDWEK